REILLSWHRECRRICRGRLLYIDKDLAFRDRPMNDHPIGERPSTERERDLWVRGIGRLPVTAKHPPPGDSDAHPCGGTSRGHRWCRRGMRRKRLPGRLELVGGGSCQPADVRPVRSHHEKVPLVVE